MAPDEAEDALRLFWEHFFKAETGTYEKSTWLDLFLAEFLIRINDGANPKELINFCPVSGVVSLVGCELLCGIHRVTSCIDAQGAPPAAADGSEPALLTSLFSRANAQSSEEILRKYLLGGVAWRCLVLLRALGVEGLSCCRQLSSVLIWLFGELSSAPASSPAASPEPSLVPPAAPRKPIHQLFSHRIWAKQQPLQGPKAGSAAASDKDSVTGRSRRPARAATPERASSESADSRDELQALSRSLAVQLRAHDGFDYFDCMDGRRAPPAPPPPKPRADLHATERHRRVLAAEIAAFDFALLAAELLRELCEAESGLAGAEGSQISMRCIGFALRSLCSLQFGAPPSRDAARMKLALTELLMVALDQVLAHPDLCARLIDGGILPMMLRILEDVIAKNAKREGDRAEEPDGTEAECLLRFVFGVAYSVTAFFHCLLMQCRSVEQLRRFTDQFRLYAECLKGALLRDCVALLMRVRRAARDEAALLARRLVEAAGRLVGGMKRVRSEVLHSAACPRARHKACRARVAAGAHHHHDILGEPSGALPPSGACCVAVLYGSLAALLADEEVAAVGALRSKTLRVMLACGACCCLAPGALVESVVRLVLAHGGAAALGLQVLERAVYGELGAGVLQPRAAERLPCAVCEPREPARRGPAPDRKGAASFLIHYNSLLQLDNPAGVLHAAVAHLLRVTPRCRPEVKHELLFSVIYPTFIVAKHRYLVRLEEAAYFLTAACLNIFASLLSEGPFAERFIRQGGLGYVLELVALPEFCARCCSILEIAIVVEIRKLAEDEDGARCGEAGSLSSVRMLFDSLAAVTDRCYRVFRLWLPPADYEELVDVSAEREALALAPLAAGAGRAAAAGDEGCTVEETVEDHLEVLKNACTFWKTCAGLCLCSPLFRAYVAGSPVLLHSYALLKLLLRRLRSPPVSPALPAPALPAPAPDARLLTRLLEALLIVQLSLEDVTSGRSKVASCALVRGALVAPAAGAPAAGAPSAPPTGLRALCEALVRVAVAEPSRRHAMPALTHAKVPPLACAPAGSSAEGSSSEDSAVAVYGSDRSDTPARPDDGYEADVEINKFDLLYPTKNRKVSSTLSSAAAMQLGALAAPGADGGERTRAGLAHPELCLIVLDILTQLIDKLLKSKRSDEEDLHLQRVGAALARACCARLAGALAGGRPPPRLLQRLLAAPPAVALLSTADDQLEELQRSILELVCVVGQQSVEPSEAAALLRLLSAPAPPLALLLPPLQRLLAAAAPHTPDCILTFPIELDPAENAYSLSEEFEHLTTSGVSSQSHVAETTACKLQQAHLRAGIRSVWSEGAARCGVEGAGWAPWLQGFALVLWLRAEPRAHESTEAMNGDSSSEPEAAPRGARRAASGAASGSPATELAHVMSLGHDSLMFEIWVDTHTGCVTFRLSRPEAGSARVVGSARAAATLPPRWACVALNVRERVLQRHMYIEVTMFIDGYECETVSLPVQGILVRKVVPTHVVLGWARAARHSAGAYHLAGARVFRSPLLTAAHALHLAAHGPDSSCMVRCESPNFASLLTPNVLDSNIDWDQVFELPAASLRAQHDALLLAYSAAAPSLVNLYHQTAPHQAVFSGLGGAAGAGGAAVPEALCVTWAGAPLPARHRGLAPALYMLQGVDVLLYLYARVVELEGSAAEQAMALGILLRACRVDDRLYVAFHAEDVPDMLLTVFAAPKCQLTPHLLKVILDEACSAPLLRVSGSAVQVAGRSDAVVLEPALLALVVRAASRLDCTKEFTWEMEGGGGARWSQRGSLWALALAALRALLRPEHPRRAFNHDQLARADLLRLLLLACKERFLNSDSGPLEPCASESLVELARGLVGEPPQPHRLAALADFLLLMHQASDTFVTHSRANFYFLLTSETQEMSEFASSSRKRSSRRSRRRPADSGAAPAGQGAAPVQDDSDRIESSLDSAKQLKGILNMQIKEGRKHNVSSMSENSDTTAEAEPTEGSETESRVAALVTNGDTPTADSGAPTTDGDGPTTDGGGPTTDGGAPTTDGDGPTTGGGAPAGDLTEYIVVDADDVTHTTVEMYSSGIYHQGRVRAGAAPGWAACEGLLLLLRDALAVLPEHELQQTAGAAVPAESALVLCNHRASGVRAAAVRALAALTRRAPPDLARRLRALHYYTHLANQVSLYEGSWELAAACAALLTKCDVPLEDQLHDDIWTDVSEESILRSPPLLALLPSCLDNAPLALVIVRLMRRVVEKAPLKLLGEVSLAEVAVRALRGAARAGALALLPALHALLADLALKALAAPHALQAVVELHHMLTFAEGDAAAARAARDAQVALYGAELDYLEGRLRDGWAEPARPGSSLANVLSSAVYLGGPGWSRGEMAARLAGAAARAVAFLLTLPPDEPLGADEALLGRLLHALPAAVAGPHARPKWWAGAGSELAAPLQELAGWALARGGAAGVAALRALYGAPPAALQLLAPDPQHMRKLAVYILSILKSVHGAGEEGPPPVEYAITDWARGWALALQAGLPDRLQGDALLLEAGAARRADQERCARAVARARAAVGKVVFAKEALAARVAESAMQVTRAAVEAQNAERKRFMEHLRRAHARQAHARLAWDRLIETHTHEQGVWHDPRSYPASWALDSTEGPGRVRVRLRRAHLDVHPKFLKPQHRHKAEPRLRAAPLRSVVGAGGARGGLVARLQPHETVAYMARATAVTVARELAGELLLSDRCVHFVPDAADAAEGAASWPLEGVLRAATRRWCLREAAVELFLASGQAHLLAFRDTQDRNAFLKALAALTHPEKIEPDSLADAMAEWRSGAITNWEYLMRLNGLAGRSYNDLMQYPVLPFVLADYSSRILDLSRAASFRDLARPMAVQNKAREQHYIKLYNDLAAAQREGCSPLIARQPHHYASLYSNSGGVLHYLVRVPPFTQQFLNYQDNNFDMPDRTFHSLATTWRLITNDSPTDVKELIPELFYLPELFRNDEGLNLGVRQCGLSVDDVELPPWAADARLFTLIHRQALEARVVTEALPHWIDLVFGHKQTGQAARDALNVFPACTYYGFDPGALEQAEDRTAAAAMVRLYGQTPRQLLRSPHPSVQHALTEHARDEAAVWAGVRGARWGRYCGSPALPPPAVASRRSVAAAAAVAALPPARSAAALPPRTALLTLLGEAAGAGLVSWGHSDNIVRLKRRRDAAPDLLLHTPALDQITVVCSSPSPSPCVFVGHASGRVLCVSVHVSPGLAPRVRTRALLAHAAAVSAVRACAPAALLLTASRDGRIVLWDLNTLSYIRTLPNRDQLPVTHAALSATLSDAATAHERAPAPSGPAPDDDGTLEYEKDAAHKYKSLIRVHTCNATFVGSVKVPEEVTGLCYSAAPEGVSVNCVAAALRSGGVRLYSSWDLRPTVYIPPAARAPLLSLEFGSDSMLLFGCYEGGTVVAWEAGGARPAPVRIHPAHALY